MTRVLVIDDEHYMRKVTRTILTAIGVKTILEAPDAMAGRLAMLRRVGGDRLIRDLIDLLLEGAPRKLEAARAALAEGDADRVGRTAHALTSSAGNLGAAELQQAASALERCAGGGPGDCRAACARCGAPARGGARTGPRSPGRRGGRRLDGRSAARGT